MEDDSDQLDQYVEDLLQDRKPERTSLGTEDALRARQVAAMLRAARPGTGLPSPDFLHRMQRSIQDWIKPEETTGAAASRGYTRRSLLLGGVGGIAAGVLAVLGVERVTRNESAPYTHPALVTDGKGSWQNVLALSDLPDGVPTRFTSGAVEGYVLRTGQGVRGLSAVCTHMGCLLNWSRFRTQFECPCHGATFDVNGKPSGDYAPGVLRPLPPVLVRVQDGQVQVYSV
jgi:cytochrome b6-f complex iron-sulfur subunit